MQFAYHEAPDFFTDMSATEEHYAMWSELTEAVSDAFNVWDGSDGIDIADDELAFFAYGSLVGHGYGLWDGTYQWGKAFHEVVCADSALREMAMAIDSEFSQFEA